MKLPHHQRAMVPRDKIVQYLLSPTHDQGRHKWAFFTAFGFNAQRWEELAAALRRHANYEVADTEHTPFGTRYAIEGIIETPDGRSPRIRSVWFLSPDEEVPRFVTAYPLKGS